MSRSVSLQSVVAIPSIPHIRLYCQGNIRVCQGQYHSSQPWPFPASLMLGCITMTTSEHVKVSITPVSHDHSQHPTCWAVLPWEHQSMSRSVSLQSARAIPSIPHVRLYCHDNIRACQGQYPSSQLWPFPASLMLGWLSWQHQSMSRSVSLQSAVTIPSIPHVRLYCHYNIRACQGHYHSSQPWPFPASLMLGCIVMTTSEHVKVSITPVSHGHSQHPSC